MKSPKNSKAIQIVREIQTLLEKLEGHISVGTEIGSKRTHPKKQSLDYSGASGGIRMLIGEGYFKEAKSLPEVTVRLRQEGFNYPRNTISMTLLRAVRNRFLVRIPTEKRSGKEKWVYVIRK